MMRLDSRFSGRALHSVLCALVLASAAFAEENRFVLGIDSRCAYGLVPCWPEVREPLTKAPGLKSVSEKVDGSAWTCEVTTTTGAPPDLAALGRALRAGVGEQFFIRGVEAQISGTLSRESDGTFVLRQDEPRLVVRLAALTRKIQFDPRAKTGQPITEQERAAFETLASSWTGMERTVRVIGPISPAADLGSRPLLEVRSFLFP